MILTREQIEKLAEIIKQHATWFAWRVFGKNEISEEDLLHLKQMGKLPMDVSIESIKYAYVLGKLEAVLKEGEFKNLTWSQLMEAATGRYTDIDKLQIEAAEFSAHNYYRHLADDIKNNLYDRLAQATNQVITESHVKGIIKDKIKMGVDLNQSYQKVARTLVEDLKEPERNWTRVATTELHAARQRGLATAIIQKENIYENSDGVDSNVAITHGDDACDDCRRIYYDSKTGNPKIFKLKELLENEGTNYQRPWRKHAKPVLAPLHPGCVGVVTYVPEGWGWTEDHEFTVLEPEKTYPEFHEAKEVKDE